SARMPQASPPASTIPRTASSGSARSTTATRAPSRASRVAVASPIPDAPPVTMATESRFMLVSPWASFGPPDYQWTAPARRQGGSAPPPDRLLEVTDPGGAAVKDHLAELIEDRRRGSVDERAEERQLDHRALPLRDGHEARYVWRIQIGERYLVN